MQNIERGKTAKAVGKTGKSRKTVKNRQNKPADRQKSCTTGDTAKRDENELHTLRGINFA